MSQVKKCELWIKKIMSKIIENLGSDAEEVRYELSNEADFVMSNIYYVCVKFKNKTSGQREELPMILKKPTNIDDIRKILHIDDQFHNEIVFYMMYVQPDDNFPKCYYYNKQPPNNTIIALENITKHGYHVSTCKYNAPLDYTLAAIREIARLHAKGYVMKELQPEKFFDIIGQLKEIRYRKDIPFISSLDEMAKRSVRYLRSHGHDAVFCDKLEVIMLDEMTLHKNTMKMVEPLEPLSTLCHGDCTLANVLFKKEDNGAYQAKLIDFALCRYGTPVFDLSTYLFLSCSNKVRRENFFEILKVYHGALTEYLMDAGVIDIDKYSYDAILHDYKRGGLFGFIIACFFLPTLMGYISVNFESFKIDKWIEENKNAGGDTVSEILADMLLHLVDIGCLKHML